MGLDGLENRVFDAVLFDMDGTLVDSTAAVYRAWAAWAVEHGVSADQMRGHDGIPAASIVAKFLPEDEREAGVLRINQLELEDTGEFTPAWQRGLMPHGPGPPVRLPPGGPHLAVDADEP